MELLITFYKPTGKWYASFTVAHEENYRLYTTEFDEFIRKAIGKIMQSSRSLGDWYVTVQDTGTYPDQFHNLHYSLRRGKFV